MGYHGMGMQRWITTMKPKKFLGKKSKTDGGGGGNINDRSATEYYHLKNRKLDNLQKKKYPREYKAKLRLQLIRENRARLAYFFVSIVISGLALWLFLRFLEYKLR